MEEQSTLIREKARRKILVVDDNHDAADTLAMMLRLKGYDVAVRYDGKDAVAAGAIFLPKIAILDIGMPGLDGYETCRLVRRQTWGKNMVLIALTGYGQEDDIRKSEEAGFDDHLLKPVDLAHLTRLIEVAN